MQCSNEVSMKNKKFRSIKNKYLSIVIFIVIIIIFFSCIRFIGQKNKSGMENNLECGDYDTQLEMNLCSEDKYKQVQSMYEKLFSGMVPEKEKQWIVTRDTRCKEENKEYEEGSIYPSMYYPCLVYETNMHVDEPAVVVNQYYTQLINGLNYNAKNIRLNPSFVTQRLITSLTSAYDSETDGDTFFCSNDRPDDTTELLVKTTGLGDMTAKVSVRLMNKWSSFTVLLVNKNGWKIDKIECSTK
jgi:uncharacterized protein YecT (DUF1311 family)